MELKWDIDAGKYLTDKSLNIVQSHLNKVCKYQSGESACRYIALTATNGFVCVKNTPLGTYVDIEVKNNPKWLAKGNNCDGFGDYAKKESGQENRDNPNNPEKNNPAT